MSEFVNTLDVLGDEALAASIISRSITEIADNTVTSVGERAFTKCTALTTADFPAVTIIKDEAFRYCSKLTTVNFPMATQVSISVFENCTALTTADFSAKVHFSSYVFRKTALTALILRNTSGICELGGGKEVLSGTPIASGTGYIYVPRALLSDDDATKDYRRARYWSNFSAQFRALEDYTVDGTITGELDPTKI